MVRERQEARRANLDPRRRALGSPPGSTREADGGGATLKRVRQATRHEIWRIAHPFDPEVAVRILCWFPADHIAVVALIGGDKAGISDVWYDSATVRAEAEVDQWLREREARGNQ